LEELIHITDDTRCNPVNLGLRIAYGFDYRAQVNPEYPGADVSQMLESQSIASDDLVLRVGGTAPNRQE
jgi:hypothetical protein